MCGILFVLFLDYQWAYKKESVHSSILHGALLWPTLSIQVALHNWTRLVVRGPSAGFAQSDCEPSWAYLAWRSCLWSGCALDRVGESCRCKLCAGCQGWSMQVGSRLVVGAWHSLRAGQSWARLAAECVCAGCMRAGNSTRPAPSCAHSNFDWTVRTPYLDARCYLVARQGTPTWAGRSKLARTGGG